MKVKYTGDAKGKLIRGKSYELKGAEKGLCRVVDEDGNEYTCSFDLFEIVQDGGDADNKRAWR